MLRPQAFLFPAVLAVILALIYLAGLFSAPVLVEASTQPAADSAGSNTEPADLVGTTESTSGSQPQSSDCTLPDRYPQSIQRWCGLIESYANKQNLEPRLVAAVMLQESGGDPQAYSVSGAVGLMQIMPRDGLAASFTCSGRPCFSARPFIAELQDPEFNISFGTRMLAGLVEKYGGLRQALKAYGPMDAGFSYADKVLAIFENYR